MRLSKGGLISCGIYIAFLSLMTGLMFLVADPKARYLLGAFAVFPVAILLVLFGRFLPTDSWLDDGYFNLALSLVIAYCFGWAINWLLNRFDLLDE